jgi:hypothetical protein
MTLTADITTADLQAELPAGHPSLALLRRVHEFRTPGYDPFADPTILDLEPLWGLLRDGLVRYAWEPGGIFDADGYEAEIRVWHLTEHGLEELVIHGRTR